MAIHTTEGTGALRLKQVTPVITALFGGYGLDASLQGEGEAYIRYDSEAGRPTWAQVAGKLEEMGERLNLGWKRDQPMKDLGAALAAHIGKDTRAVEEFFSAGWVSDYEWEEDAHLDGLFDLALVLDDGHGLLSVELETASYCTRPWHGEFGGTGFYVGRGVSVDLHTSAATEVGNDLNEAVVAGDVDAAVVVLRRWMAGALDWISDTTVKLEVAKRLGLPA